VHNYQLEKFEDVIEEMKPLLKDHWEEIAINQDKIKLNPNIDAYQSLQDGGLLRIYTARDNGTLFGYFAVVVSPNLHYQDHVFAECDVIFISKEYRNKHIGSEFISFVESSLTKEGVSVFCINTKVHKAFDGLLSFLGYDLIERKYGKYIKGES
jgi:GNAT superfamily N-acetyltransferase